LESAGTNPKPKKTLVPDRVVFPFRDTARPVAGWKPFDKR
jgi:hypothetical protein